MNDDDATGADCTTCLDTGYICDDCAAADGQCVCADGPELVPCPDCEE